MRASELPASPSRSVLTIGMAPPTAASKLSATRLLLGERGQRDAMPGQQRLVGGDHRLPGLERRRRPPRAPDRPSPPISSTKTSISRIGGERHRIVDPAQPLEIDAALLAARARADRDHLDRPAAARRRASRCCSAISRTTAAPTVPRPAIPTLSGCSHRAPSVAANAAASAAWRAGRRCATFPGRFQGSAGCCGRPGGCAARSRPARCAR